jgi:ribosomal protein L3 glutamine methyltransferase
MATNHITVEQLIREGAALLERAEVWFGHGSDNAWDEAAELVFYALDLRHEQAPVAYSLIPTDAQRARVQALLQRRVHERLPAAYLTQRMWFAGHELYVDQRVLVPRSPLAELIEAEFAPWLVAAQLHDVLDIGTGSGCIAIATALALPHARLDAADVSEAALAVARINLVRHGLTERVRLMCSDVFAGLGDTRYDLIISNPPYVGAAELAGLPREYVHEPRLGLAGGADGLDIVLRILRQAHAHLRQAGALIVEVGNSEDRLQELLPEVPFTWLEFERGGGGVFLLMAQQLADCAPLLQRLDSGISAAVPTSGPSAAAADAEA